MASTTKIMNRLTFAKRAFSTSAARMSGGTTTPGMSKKMIKCLQTKIDTFICRTTSINTFKHNNKTFYFIADVKTWKMLTFLVGGPAIIFGHYMAFRPHFAPYPGEDPHARPDFVAYDYLRLRSKVKFKVESLFEIKD